MKKKFLSLGIGLGLLCAFLLSFAACAKDKEPSSGSYDGVANKLLYWEMSPSVDADTKLKESVCSLAELENSIEYRRDPAPFAEIDDDFFAEKSLLIYRFAIPYSGGQALVGHTYTNDGGKSITVNVWYHCGLNPEGGNVLMLIELGANDYTSINVRENFGNDKFDNDKVLILLTKEATDETIFKDFTVEDFSQVNAISIKEIDGRSSDTSGLTYRVRQCLLEDPTGSTIPDHLKNYKRSFSITLAEKSKENVLRVVNILLQRDDIESAFPNYFIPVE